MNQSQCRKYGLECLGTIFFLYVILLTGNAWAIGLALAIVIYIAGPVTGGHFNPAVSLMMYANDTLSTEDTIMYIVAQILGGLIALGLYRFI
jgi:aquaporin Z